MTDLIRAFKKARQVGTPLVGITTPDPADLIQKICESLESPETLPIFRWDCMKGLVGLTKVAKQALNALLEGGENPDATGGLEIVPPDASKDLVVALTQCLQLPEDSIVFLLNTHRWLHDPLVCQAVWNLRNPYKLGGSTLVLLAPLLNLPIELEQDIMILDDPMPPDEFYRSLLLSEFQNVRNSHESLDLPDPDEETQRRTIEALRGLAPFPAEDAIANAMTKEGVDLERVWERKRKVVEQTRGLQIDTSIETFDDLGGLSDFKRFMTHLFPPHSEVPITAIIWLDELEKAIAGSSGPVKDNTGISDDFLGVLLREMEDNRWTGILAVGPPGSGKSIAAKATGNTFKIPTIKVDLGGMKGGIVGESEGNIRQAMKVIKGVGGAGCFFIATCNGIEELKPELIRRFRLGTWFFDLPTSEERESIWKICLAQYGLNPHQDKPDDIDWTGAEIRNCCELAWRMKLPVAEAGLDIQPVAKQIQGKIERLRLLADNKWNSTSYRGAYRMPKETSEEEPLSRFTRMDLD